MEAAPASGPALDPSRASFWPVEEGPAPDQSGSVVSVSLAEVELLDGVPPESAIRNVSIFEAALECIESLIAQGRNDDALALITRNLALRPRNALLLERREEIEEDEARCARRSPGRALRVQARHSQRSIVTGTRRAANS